MMQDALVSALEAVGQRVRVKERERERESRCGGCLHQEEQGERDAEGARS
jgi:hypothetical protein